MFTKLFLSINPTVLDQQLNIMSLSAFDFALSNVAVIFLIVFSTVAFAIKSVKSLFNRTFYAVSIFWGYLEFSGWDFCTHPSLVSLFILVLYNLFSNKEQEQVDDVPVPVIDEDKSVSGEVAIEPTVEPITVQPEKEGISGKKTNGDLIVAEAPKSAPQAIIKDLKDLLEWLGGKVRDLLGIESREALTPLVIIKALVKLVLKSSLILGAMWLAFASIPLIVALYLVYSGIDMANFDFADDLVLLQIFGWWMGNAIIAACIALTIIVGVFFFYALFVLKII